MLAFIIKLYHLFSSQLIPPPIQEKDARKGILSLMERGLIPPAAELTLDPNPVRQKLVTMYDPRERKDHKGTGVTGGKYQVWKQQQQQHLHCSDDSNQRMYPFYL